MSNIITAGNKIAAMTGGTFYTAALPRSASGSVAPTPATILASYVIHSLSEMTVPTENDTWPLYSPTLPDGNGVKTNCGVMFDTTGIGDARSLRTGKINEHPGIQLIIRTNDYQTGWNKIQDIALLLDAITNSTVTLGTVTYQLTNCSRTSPVVYLGLEPGTKRRMKFSVNYLLSYLTI